MKTGIKLLIGAAALALVGTGIRWFFPGETSEVDLQPKDVRLVVQQAKTNGSIASVHDGQRIHRKDNTSSFDRTDEASRNSSSSFFSRTDNFPSSEKLYIPRYDDKSNGHRENTVRRPFPVSRAVRDACHSDLAAVESEDNECKDIFRALERMAYEDRDPVWTQMAEQKLYESLRHVGGEFTVRSLECRERTCALEIVTDPSSIISDADTMATLDRIFWAPSEARAIESGDDGVKSKVVLLVYIRK